jgi:hypothetical protein
MVRNRRGSVVVIAVLAVLAALASGRLATATVGEGGSFVCDGFTGCYIDGVLVNPSQECRGQLDTGPFRCTTSRTAGTVLPTTTTVSPGSVCDVHQIRLGQPTLQIYYSTHGTISVQQQRDTITFTANCPSERAG